ncbi:MAG TPA: adenylate/guanylate cyclase domain-containing protein [Acidimicrobiales bacterium]
MGEEPKVRYAKSTDGYIAYEVLGEGPFDLLRVMAGSGISIDSIADEPHWSRFDARLASFARLIRFDRRGVGLSDGPSLASPLTIEQNVADAMAVLDAVGSARAAIFGHSLGGAAAMMLCATFPERASHLVLWHGKARACWAPDYAWAPQRSDQESWMDAFFDPGSPDGVERAASLMVADPRIRAWWARAHRQAAGPEATRAQHQSILDTDVRSVLSTIAAPTLVLCRPNARVVNPADSRYLAEHIPGARYVELAGTDEFYFAGDADAVVDEIEEFLTGARTTNPVADRVLTTVLFSDIVASTRATAALGDRAWRDRLDAHDAMVRRQLERFGGREIKTTGDGFLTTFDGPARAIHCGCAIRDGARRLGLEVRVGVHTGEVERRGEDIGGITVHLGQRVCASAQANEVLVSSTVKDLSAGSGIEFEDRGEHELKGLPGSWRLLAVVS